MLGRAIDIVIYILTALMCIWSVHSYACATRGQNTEAKAAAKRYERRQRIRALRSDPSWKNFAACLVVKVDPRVYQA